MKHLAEIQQEESKLRSEQEQLKQHFDKERRKEQGLEEGSGDKV